jgi:hypothetical protein
MTEQVATNALALLQSKSRSGRFPRKQREVVPGLAFTLRQAFQFVRHLEVATLVFRREMAAQEVSEFAEDGSKSGQSLKIRRLIRHRVGYRHRKPRGLSLG